VLNGLLLLMISFEKKNDKKNKKGACMSVQKFQRQNSNYSVIYLYLLYCRGFSCDVAILLKLCFLIEILTFEIQCQKAKDDKNLR